MTDLLRLYDLAADEFGRRVHAVPADGWRNPTPCTEWTVRDLVNHLVVEQLWVPHLMAGQTVEEVGDSLDGDRLGPDPAGAWDRAIGAARAAFGEPGALDRTVNLSYGPTPASDYLRQMTDDLAVHAWDLARGIGADDTVDTELVHAVYEDALPQADGLAQSGLFAPRVEVPDDADEQTKLLGLFGRRR